MANARWRSHEGAPPTWQRGDACITAITDGRGCYLPELRAQVPAETEDNTRAIRMFRNGSASSSARLWPPGVLRPNRQVILLHVDDADDGETQTRRQRTNSEHSEETESRGKNERRRWRRGILIRKRWKRSVLRRRKRRRWRKGTLKRTQEGRSDDGDDNEEDDDQDENQDEGDSDGSKGGGNASEGTEQDTQQHQQSSNDEDDFAISPNVSQKSHSCWRTAAIMMALIWKLGCSLLTHIMVDVGVADKRVEGLPILLPANTAYLENIAWFFGREQTDAYTEDLIHSV